MTTLAPGQIIAVFRKAKLRRFTIAVDGKPRPGLFSSKRSAIAAFDFDDGELEAATAATAGRAIGLADLAAIREGRITGAVRSVAGDRPFGPNCSNP